MKLYSALDFDLNSIDRTLGGMEFQLRLRDLLAQHFNAQKKTKNDVTKDARSMQKLFKEAGRVKQVLSANVDHFAQVCATVIEMIFVGPWNVSKLKILSKWFFWFLKYISKHTELHKGCII